LQSVWLQAVLQRQ